MITFIIEIKDETSIKLFYKISVGDAAAKTAIKKAIDEVQAKMLKAEKQGKVETNVDDSGETEVRQATT